MKIYNYDTVTGVLLSEGLADENFLEPDEPIVPGYATPKAPPEVEAGKVAVYEAVGGVIPQNHPFGDWVVKPDYRSTQLYRTEDGSEFFPNSEYFGIGDLPPFLTDEARPSPAHVWLNDEWTIDPDREKAIQIAEATATRATLLAEADRLIAPLMDDFVLDELDAAGSARLKALSQYRKALRAIDVNEPGGIVWPVKP